MSTYIQCASFLASLWCVILASYYDKFFYDSFGVFTLKLL